MGGAGQGIGRDICIELSKQGAHVIAFSRYKTYQFKMFLSFLFIELYLIWNRFNLKSKKEMESVQFTLVILKKWIILRVK